MKDLLYLLEKWDRYSAETHVAIQNRQINKLKTGFSNGKKCFTELKFIIINHDKEQLLEHKDRIKKTLDHWQALTKELEPWMEEVKTDIKRTQHRVTQNKKLSKTYGYIKPNGQFLKVKTR